MKVLTCMIVMLHVALSMWGAYQHSPTVDEPAYLISGISHWEFGRFDLCKVSPPLVRLFAAVPVRLANPRLDWSNYRIGPGTRAEHPVGHDFVVANGFRSFWLFTLGRWGCIPFSLIGAWVSYRWAHELFGAQSAVVALLLWCFSPNILAHAQMLTPDIGVTSLCLATCYALWKWSLAPTWSSALMAGGTLGLAVLAKTNALALYPSLSIAVLINACSDRRLRSFNAAAQLFSAIIVSVYVINLGYGFEGTFTQLGDYHFFSSTLASLDADNRFRDTLIAEVPVPLPSAFLEGLDLQRKDFENSNGTMKTYFRGRWYNHGWWWYYFYVVAVKEPAGTWLLGLIAGAALIAQRSARRIEIFCYLVVPGTGLFALACSQTGFGHSLRYVLPAFPFAYVIASSAVSLPVQNRQKHLSIAALVFSIVSSLCVYPHDLSYFNEIVGGPRNGHYHLLDGNVDWGQDLLFVNRWIQNHPEAWPAYVSHWGFLSLKDLGLELDQDEIREGRTIPTGWYLISVNHLHVEYRQKRPELAQFLLLPPTSRVGYTTCVYQVR